MADQQSTRREVVRKAVYMAPMIVTLPAVLSFASAGSREDSHTKDKAKDKDHYDKVNHKEKDKDHYDKVKYQEKDKNEDKGKNKKK
jgi:hypothetical protein